jgi:hypothetical protein
MGVAPLRRVRIRCAKCGLEVERILWEPQTQEWLCPDCDPDQTPETEEHGSVWDDAVEDGITPDYLKPGWGERRARTPDKEVPEWVTNLGDFREVIWAHPQAKRFASRWALVAYLYHRMGWPARDVARECRLSESKVKRIIERLDNRAAKLRERRSGVEMPTAEEMERLSVRKLAARLKCSVGKAHALKKLARNESAGVFKQRYPPPPVVEGFEALQVY